MPFARVQKIASTLCIATLAAAVPELPADAQDTDFRDISGHWAQDCINALAQRGIISGYLDNTFRPQADVSRGEYAAMMNQGFSAVEAERQGKDFVDISDDYWGQQAVQTAYRKGFVSGYPNGEFRPQQPVSRQEAFVSLASGLDYNAPDGAQSLLRATFEDAAQIADYAEGKIAAVAENNALIAHPAPRYFQRLMAPSNEITRAQVAAAICQAKFIGEVPETYVVEAAYRQPALTNLNLVQTLQGHTGGIMDVRITPDRQTLVSGGDGVVKIWHLSNGELRRTLRDHSAWVYGVDVTPDGRRLATGSLDGTVKIWNLQTGELLHDLTDHGDSIIDIDIGPGGGLVASGSDDQTAKVWDLGTGELLTTFEEHPAPVNAVAIAPDGYTVATGSFDGRIRIWDRRRVEATELLLTLPGHQGGVHALAISPDGSTLYSGGEDNTIKAWDLDSGELVQVVGNHAGRVDSIAISPNGETLASGGFDQTVKVWDVATGTLKDSLGDITSPTVDIGPTGNTLVSGSGSPVDVDSEALLQIWRSPEAASE